MIKKHLIFSLLGVVAFTAILTACSSSAEEVAEMPTAVTDTQTSISVPDPARGQLIYELGPEGVYEPFCSNCHTLTNLDHLGPGFEGLAERAATQVPGLTAEEYIRQSIVDPAAYIVEGNWPEEEFMPTNYGEAYSEQDINDLIAFLLMQ
jgi:cytochrome c2